MSRVSRRSHAAFAAKLAAGAAACLLIATPAAAGPCDALPPVFDGDPCDTLTGPFPMLPGLPLVLPSDGPRGSWRSGPPLINNSFTGDVDLAVRIGLHPSDPDVPFPVGSLGGPAPLNWVAGGGGASQGTALDFTVLVTDGPVASPPYGSVLDGPELDDRPVAVFAYADLDHDGWIGPILIDGIADDAVERQEAIAHVGRQVGQISGGRLLGSIAVRVGAPASLGGLKVSLAAGMYTGSDPDALWSDGSPIMTNWPFFPPLDPGAILFLDEPNPPDPAGPNIVFYRTPDFLLPSSDHPSIGGAFAIPVDGTGKTNDYFISHSGDVAGARFFRNVDPATFSPSSRMVVRVGADESGAVRKLVLPAGEMAIAPDQVFTVRVLPIDSLGNIADPQPGGFPARLVASGGIRILSPNFDGNDAQEDLLLEWAKGVTVTLSTQGVKGSARVVLTKAAPNPGFILDQLLVAAASGVADTDGDGVPDDGDGSGVVGDRPCTPADIASSTPCDDNCPTVVNPGQADSDEDGQGNCCDGTCVLDSTGSGCLECPQAGSRFLGTSTKARVGLGPRGGLKPDAVRIRGLLGLTDGQSIAPDAETVEIAVAQGERLHYGVDLVAAFTARSGSRPSWIYKDPHGSVGGVTKAVLRGAGGGVRLRLLARGMSLVDTMPAESLPSGLVLSVRIGNDAFVRHLRCSSSLRSVRCASGN